MSVAFANKVIDGLRKYGVEVHFINGWASRGNGMSSNYVGGLMHHTATSYGMAPKVLWEGRIDLDPPLCNSAGNYDGSVTIVAAHPANHAGASGGRSMGPLPVTGLFNKYVWGHEIVYPGNDPMTAGQYAVMIILGKVLTEILGRPNAEWIRAHAETSITGKWDPGYAPSKTINMATVRRDINNYSPEDDPDWEVKLKDGTWHPGGDQTARHAMAYIHQISQRHAGLSTDLSDISNQLEVIGGKLGTADVDVVSVIEILRSHGLTTELTKEQYKSIIIDAIGKNLFK